MIINSTIGTLQHKAGQHNTKQCNTMRGNEAVQHRTIQLNTAQQHSQSWYNSATMQKTTAKVQMQFKKRRGTFAMDRSQ